MLWASRAISSKRTLLKAVVSSAENRAKGFVRAMTEEPGAKSRLLTVESSLGGVAAGLRQAYEQELFDRIFTYSDLVAMEAAWALEEMGVDPGRGRNDFPRTVPSGMVRSFLGRQCRPKTLKSRCLSSLEIKT